MLCIVSAMKAEVLPLIGLLGAEKVNESEVWLDKAHDILITSAGVGYLEAALNLGDLLLVFPQIESVIFCGSAGVYPGERGFGTGDLCICSDTVLCDGAAEMKMGQYASIMDRRPIKANFDLGPSLPKTRVATTISLTLSDQMAEQLADGSQSDVENMELYGIASVCKKKSILWNAVLGITNTVGSNGHLEWKQNYQNMADKCSRFLYETINRNGV